MNILCMFMSMLLYYRVLLYFLLLKSYFDVIDASLHERDCVQCLVWKNFETSMVICIISSKNIPFESGELI